MDMSDGNEHRDRWSDEIAAYALGALGERESALLEHHLAGCEQCSAELLWLQPAVDVIPTSVERLEPPPALRERLLATVCEEAAAAAAPAAPQRARRFRMPFLGSFGLRPALVAGAVLLLAAGVAGYELRDGTSTSRSDAETVAAVAEKPGTVAHGTLEVSGDEGVLHVVGMPPNRDDQVYQAWIQEPAGAVGKSKIHPSSVFVVSGSGTGEVAIPAGLDDAARVMVTREPKGGSTLPSESPMLTAEMD
jgi:anti-sigma factor RsiW